MQLHTFTPIYLIETPFNDFAIRADPDRAALFTYGNMIYDISNPTLVDLTRKFFVLYTHMNVYLYYYK